jgi:hypothetical protein
MAQIITPPLAGHDLGFASGGTRVRILVGTGDPNQSSTDSSAGDLASAGIGSLYLRSDGSSATTCLYVKTGATTVAAPTGTWTNK